MTFKPCAVIPSRNHASAVPGIVARLRGVGLPVFIVDDGSDEPFASALARLHDPEGGVHVERSAFNRGKGAAVMRGFDWAAVHGYSHVLQIDADGQHDLATLDSFLKLAARRPEAVVSGRAIFDHSISLGRRVGRWVTHFWVWIETLSFHISDSMCGFRVYPLAPVAALRAETRLGQLMDFDIEILVRLFWRGVPVLMLPVRVTYPAGNTSNFDYWRDNWRITKMHSGLVLAMLLTLPAILARRATAKEPVATWWNLEERGLYAGLRLLAAAERIFGRRGCKIAALPILAYFFATGAERREASMGYLNRIFRSEGLGRTPTLRDTWRHHVSFLDMAVDRFAAWVDREDPPSVEFPDSSVLDRLARNRLGALILVSHLGNIDVSRAWASSQNLPPMTVLVHTRHAIRFNKIIERLNPAFSANMIQVTEIGPETALMLDQRIRQGEWIFMAADRTPVGGGERVVMAPFLGAPAPFPQGPYILGSLLRCPVALMFCLKEGRNYRIQVEDFTDRIVLPRGNRVQAIEAYAKRFASRLEAHCREAPYQWYNFFDFWGRAEARLPSENGPSTSIGA